MTKRFYEVGGGRIVGPNGHTILAINVGQLTIEDSHRVMKCILDSLEREFVLEEVANGTARPH